MIDLDPARPRFTLLIIPYMFVSGQQVTNRAGEYRVWKAAVDEWTQEAMIQLRLTNLTAEKVGELQPSDFKQIQKGKAASNAWYLMVRNKDGETVSLWYSGIHQDLL